MLKQFPLALFDIYFEKSNGKKLKLYKYGNYLTKTQVSKVLDNPDVFFFDWKVDCEWLREGLVFFSDLKRIENEQPVDLVKLDQWRANFINWASPTLWYGESEARSLIEFSALIIMGCELSSEDFLKGFELFPLEVQSRNISMASTITFFALLIGHSDSELLKDLCKVFLQSDSIFKESEWSHTERELILKMSREGINTLSEKEKTILKEGHVQSAEGMVKELERELKRPQMGYLLSLLSEDFLGGGLKNNLKMNEMSDLELIVVLVSRAYEYDSELLRTKIERRMNDLFIGEMNKSDRLRRVVLSSIQAASIKNNDFLKIAGL